MKYFQLALTLGHPLPCLGEAGTAALSPWQLGAAGQQPAVAAGQAVRLGQAVLGRLGRLSVMVVTTVTIVKCPSHSDTVTQ